MNNIFSKKREKPVTPINRPGADDEDGKPVEDLNWNLFKHKLKSLTHNSLN